MKLGSPIVRCLIVALVAAGGLEGRASLARDVGERPLADGVAAPSLIPASKPGDAGAITRPRATNANPQPQAPAAGTPGRRPPQGGIGSQETSSIARQSGISGTGMRRPGMGSALIGGPARTNTGINGSTIRLKH